MWIPFKLQSSWYYFAPAIVPIELLDLDAYTALSDLSVRGRRGGADKLGEACEITPVQGLLTSFGRFPQAKIFSGT